jgi:hypothetical protein
MSTVRSRRRKEYSVPQGQIHVEDTVELSQKKIQRAELGFLIEVVMESNKSQGALQIKIILKDYT